MNNQMDGLENHPSNLHTFETLFTTLPSGDDDRQIHSTIPKCSLPKVIVG